MNVAEALHAASRGIHAISPELPKGRNALYTLKAPHGALATTVHFGVQPAILVKNVFDTKRDADRLKEIAPEHLEQMGFSKAEAEKIYKHQRNIVAGRALGNLVSWGLYPLSLRNPLLHYPVTVGGALGAPRIGEEVGRNIS